MLAYTPTGYVALSRTILYVLVRCWSRITPCAVQLSRGDREIITYEIDDFASKRHTNFGGCSSRWNLGPAIKFIVVWFENAWSKNLKHKAASLSFIHALPAGLHVETSTRLPSISIKYQWRQKRHYMFIYTYSTKQASEQVQDYTSWYNRAIYVHQWCIIITREVGTVSSTPRGKEVGDLRMVASGKDEGRTPRGWDTDRSIPRGEEGWDHRTAASGKERCCSPRGTEDSILREVAGVDFCMAAWRRQCCRSLEDTRDSIAREVAGVDYRKVAWCRRCCR